MITLTLVTLLLSPLLPLLALLLVTRGGGRRFLWHLLPWLPLPALLLALFGNTAVSLPLPWLLLGSELAMDGLRRPFLLLAALLWMLAGGYARHYLAATEPRTRFALLWALTLGGNLLLILAQDVASFYTGFAIMTFAGYGLVIHSGSDQARFAGRVYLWLAIVGEALMLAGLVLAASAANSLQLAALPDAVAHSQWRSLIMLCLLAGFGVKAGLPLLHLWLPLAHPVAPTPASAVLSGVMIKAGLLGWMLTLPLGYPLPAGWGQGLILLGLFAAFAGALIGLTQDNPKTVLAYSSLSQMGLMTLTLGAILLAPALALTLLPLLPVFALHHGLAKGALFLAVGPATGQQPLWKQLLVVLPGLSLIGLPLTSGYAIKQQLKLALYQDADTALLLSQLPLLLTLASVATSLLIWRFFRCLHALPRPQQGHSRSSLIGLQCWWLAAVMSSTLTGLLLLRPWPGLSAPTHAPADLWAAGWPLLLAMAAIFTAGKLAWRRPSIPAGDLLWLLLPVARLAQPLGQGLARQYRHLQNLTNSRVTNLSSRLQGLEQRLLSCEAGLRRHSALLFIGLLALSWWLL